MPSLQNVVLVAYGPYERWSFTRSGRTWSLDCMKDETKKYLDYCSIFTLRVNLAVHSKSASASRWRNIFSNDRDPV